MRSFKAEGIVIKRSNYAEADRIVTIFTKQNGKIKVKATGVRKISSRRSGHIEPLNYCIFSLYQGKGMPVLTEVESKECFPLLKKDLKRIGFAYHVCELIDGLCAENQEHPEVFLLLGRTLRKLSKEENLQLVIYEFELELLRLLGFQKATLSTARVNTQAVIEEILERSLKTKQILPQLS
ncbi:MAG: DNA repair protein RecO [Candidatus Levyibacteriota bacterium]|jgi:DNA repair protein RecO (recombination protein O)